MTTAGTAHPARRLPLGFLGALLAVLTVEAMLGSDAFGPRDDLADSWRFALRAARGPEGRAEVLCLGDSIVKTGVLPRVLENRLGGPAYNLGVFRGQAASTYYLLREAVASGARPRAVVVDFHPNLLSASVRTNAAYWPELLGPAEGLELAWFSRDPALLAKMVFPWILPSARGRDELRAVVQALAKGAPLDGLERRGTHRRNWTANAGSFVVEARPWASNHRATPNAGWKPRRSGEVYLKKFLNLAAAHGIRVFWLLPPTESSYRSRRERLGIEAFYSAYVAGWQRQFPNVVVVDARDCDYPRRAFYDEVHLNRIGASEFSVALAEAIAPYVRAGTAKDRPGWIALAPFRGSGGDVPVEDLRESRLALLRAAVRFR